MFRFPKKQRLCREKEIEKLFSNGNYFSEKPFSVIWSFEERQDSVFIKSLIVVSKKKVKLAVRRNAIKRKIKEAYRINKKQLECVLRRKDKQLNLALIYQNEETLDYMIIEEKINLVFNRLFNLL
tara:strand:- start:2082 stop:2456 length:375 start_codon:yes stop_codon:yes gene_type:complete